MTADLSLETTQDRRQQSNIVKVLKGNNFQSRILYSMKIYIQNKGKIKTFQNTKAKRVYCQQTYEKFCRKSFKNQENNTRERYKTTQRNEGHQKW